MTGTRPGWYVDDPEHPRTLRWHDGARWTQHTRADTDPDLPPGPPPHPPAWTPAYGPPGTYPPPGPPPPPPVRPPLPKAGSRPDTGQRQALVALGVISGLLLVAIVVVIALLATYEEDRTGSAADPRPPAAVPAPVPGPAPSTEPAADSPEAVAEAFLTALLAGRCEEAVGYLAAELRPPGDACSELPLPQGLGDLAEPDVGNATLDGDEALVPAGFVPAGETEPLPGTRFVLVMVREDGAWRVESIETK